jgi:hypothetical protein
VKPPTSLLDACWHLEEGRADDAVSIAERWLAQEPCSDARVLLAWTEMRRREPSRGWLESLLGAWRSVGSPMDLKYVRDDGFEELFDDPTKVIDMMRDLGRLSPLGAYASLARAGQADQISLQAISAMSVAETVNHKLWLHAMMFPALASAPVRDQIHRAHVQSWAELDRLAPDDCVIGLSHVLGIDTGERQPLSSSHLLATIDCVNKRRDALTFPRLYDELVASREASTGSDKKAAWHDALAILPNPLGELSMRLKITDLEGRDVDLAAETLAVVGERFRTSTTLLMRVQSLALLEKRGKLLAEDKAIAAELFDVRKLIRFQRFSLEWPVDPLVAEACDASAHDEIALLRRLEPES